MPEPRAATPAATTSRGPALWVLALGCLLVVLAFYYPATHLYFVGDDIWFVRPNPHWLRDAWLPSATVFHYYPINMMLLSGLPALTGYRPEFMHVFNFLLCAGIGAGGYRLLRQLGASVRAALIASLVFLTRGVNYEVITWITELSYLLVTVLTVLTVGWWDRYLRGGDRRYRVWTVIGFAAAVLTIEHALLLLPLYWLLEWLPREDVTPAAIGHGIRAGGIRGVAGWVRRQSLRYAPFVLIIVVFFAVKLGMKGGLLQSNVGPPPAVATVAVDHPRSGQQVMDDLPAERRALGFLNTPRRGYLDLLLSTGYLFLPTVTASGAEDTVLTRHPWLTLVPWVVAHVLVLLYGGPLARFLLVWIYLYLLPLAVAGVPQARYYFMGTVPAAGLVGLGLDAWCRRLGRRVPGRVLNGAVAILLAALVWSEVTFVRARLREWTQASSLVRQTLAMMQDDVAAGTREFYLLNFPRSVPGRFWYAYAFVVATEHLPRMLRPPRADVKAEPVYDRSFVDGGWATVGRYVSADEVERRVHQPGAMVYAFSGRPPWIARVR